VAGEFLGGELGLGMQTPIHMPLKTRNLHDLYTATTHLTTLATAS